MMTMLHKVDEGHIAVYYMGGALLEGTNEPGWQLKLPVVTTFELVQITVQTDKVNDVPCGTSGGVLISFDQIEVVNRLRKEEAWQTVKNYTIEYDKTWIYDKIHHEINQFCSSHTLQEVFIDKFDMLDEMLVDVLQKTANQWAPGIEIISIRVTKPSIPPQIYQNYLNIEAQKTELNIALQQQKVKEQRAETVRREARIKAESDAEINKIEMEKRVLAKESDRQMEEIENRIYSDRETSKADAHHYAVMKTIEAEQAQLTPQYLQKIAIESFSNNTKVYFGESIPTYLADNIHKLQPVLDHMTHPTKDKQ